MRVYLIGLLISASFFSSTALASNWNSYLLNREALNHFKSESFREGFKSLMSALESEPMNPILHMNLGLALLGMEEPLKAAKAFGASALLSQDQELRFVSLFNQAVAYSDAKKIEEALRAYQKALEIDPDSLEVKTNIELLLNSQQNQDGKGDGQSDPNQDPKDDKGEGQGQGQPDQDKEDNPDKKDEKEQQNKPREFKSEELTASDVKKILEELKSQEQGIRAKDYEKGPKERPSGKDW